MTTDTIDSGVKWIGTIPADWEINKIKYLAVLKGRIGWQGLTSDEYTDKGAYLITGVDFENGGINWESCVHVPMRRWEEARDIQIEDGDLLITKDGTIGKVAIVSGCNAPTSLNSGVLRISTFGNYNRKFLYWVLQSDVFWTWFADKNAGNSTIQHLYQGDFAEFKYAIPPINEQQAIAAFLDVECAKIDSIIDDLEGQIDKLERYEESLITETVTKGLDSKATRTTSGIEWIGEIPTHWETKKLRYLGSLQNGISKDADSFGSGFPFVSYGDVYNNRSLPQTVGGLVESTRADRQVFSVQYGDIFFTRTSETIKEIGIASTCLQTIENATFAGFLIRFRPSTGELSPLYSKYYFRAEMLRRYFVKEMMIVTRASLGQNLLKNLPVLLPPLDEQEKIGKYLDTRCADIDYVIADKRKQLSAIRSCRESIIYEYVTGKKRVKEVKSYAN